MQIYSQLSGHELTEVSSVLRIQNLQMALEKAVQDISLLQANLSYVIKANDELRTELAVREKREQVRMKEMEKELSKRDREMDSLRQSQQELASLLEETKQNLQMHEAASLQHEDEKRRFQRRFSQQMNSISSMEEQLAAYRYASEISYANVTQDNLRMQELENENDGLRYELQRLKGQLEKEQGKAKRLERENQGFKGWLAGVVGVRKVVDGCESMLMEEITGRLAQSR